MLESVWVAIASFWLAEVRNPPPWAMHGLEVAIEIVDAAHETPLPGPDGERRMAAVLTAIALYESRANPAAVGDHGQSLGAWQTSKHWGAPTARTAARLVVESFRVCAGHPLAERLTWYARGGPSCTPPSPASTRRMRLAARILATMPQDARGQPGRLEGQAVATDAP